MFIDALLILVGPEFISLDFILDLEIEKQEIRTLHASIEHPYRLYYELSKEERPLADNKISSNAMEDAIKAECN
ncbi:hypothetical protein RCL_jg723.t1 [Rhizophagus clarus]|uniref:Uncharacterized protein n=1 Tax=Rhizophagus clarus TaxID=94130 RepID=A0A8H3QLT2_9GLOM|nr:hypothetical protein RCL_jg723.t1 [Rhizophagus clarus]